MANLSTQFVKKVVLFTICIFYDQLILLNVWYHKNNLDLSQRTKGIVYLGIAFPPSQAKDKSEKRAVQGDLFFFFR
jgi:hypothetical protein